jgi:hypothetical protein
MTEQLTQIYDMAYSMSGDDVHIEQTNCGETDFVILNRIHVKLLAEKMGLIEPDNTARMGKVVKEELLELLRAIDEHWKYLAGEKHVDDSYIIKARAIYQKANSICRMVGLDPAILSSLDGNKVEGPVASIPPAPEVKQDEQRGLV